MASTTKKAPGNLLPLSKIAIILECSVSILKTLVAKHGLQEYKDERLDKRYAYYRVVEVMQARYDPDALKTNGVPKKAYEREKYYAAELKKLDFLQKRGSLITAEQFRQMLGETMQSARMIVETFPDRAEKDHGLEPREIERLQTACDGLLVALKQQLQAMAKDWGKKNEPHAWREESAPAEDLDQAA